MLEEQPPPKPPRPQISIPSQGATSRAGLDTPGTVAKNQRKEHYQIRQINWFDASSSKLRHSPVLIQNANGPCPLLALVNALILSTPEGLETALVETLRTREQVSLGLLLDAVFDELMSGRRGGTAHNLPDVGDLYAFLLTLHTGMNVNPSFVAGDEPDAVEAGPEWTDMHPSMRPQAHAGTFEDTREMKLYSTFNMPLVHGWLPQRDSRAYAAFDRSAKTYEDAQNIQFAEEELEAKLSAGELTSQEQNLFEDLASIKEFLNRWPTQLTEYGLEVIAKSIKPGQVAILFRNDHFST
ncbi:hypothetical protein LTS18_001184, partial [Coniosporium uncinatum]